MVSQEALKQKLHTLVADEARKIAESIVGIAACLVEQIEPQQENGSVLTSVPEETYGGHKHHDTAEDVGTNLFPESPGTRRIDAVEPSPACLDEPAPQDTSASFPPVAEGDPEASMLQPRVVDTDHQPAPHSAERPASFDEPPSDREQTTPPASLQVWEHKSPAPDVQAEISLHTARPTVAPPPHWLRHVAQQPPAHWVDRVRHSAPNLLPYPKISDLPESQHAEAENAAPATPMVDTYGDVEERVVPYAPAPHLTGTADLNPMSDTNSTPWPEFLTETPAHAPTHAPEDRATLWRAWEHEQKLRREQQGSRWNA